MKCPSCDGDFDTVDFRSVAARTVPAFQCTQCGGFWFERALSEPLQAESVALYDAPQPNYSLKNSDMFCPVDESMLTEADHNDGPAGLRTWECHDCGGVFFPKGQLALLTNFQAQSLTGPHPAVIARKQAASAVALSALLLVGILGSLNKYNFQYSAATTSPLPTAGPSVITLVLLAMAYIAGTVLAVLGRKLPIIIVGWLVIVVCMFGFAVVIFGP